MKTTLHTTPPHHPTHISGLSQLLLTRFWQNFKGIFLGPSLTDAKCQVNICPCNTCPGDICPYQEYLNCYWPDLDETLKVASWEHLEQIPSIKLTFVPDNICPGDICPYQEYLKCYLPDFDETLKVASWEHLEQIPTIKLAFVQEIFVLATFVQVTFVHIRNISTVTDPILMTF